MPSGTFTQVEATEAVTIDSNADLSIVFTGTGTVVLQRYMNAGWRDVPGGEWTEDTEDIIYGSAGRQFRLNCTDRDADIHWEIS